jgi:hypothetical protein
MSVHPVLPRLAAILALSTLAACAESPTAPTQRQVAPTKPAADLCSGYSVAEAKC